MASTEARVIDLLDGDLYVGDPYPTYAWLRENAPVYWDDANELWGISRYDDIVEIEKAKDVFINSDKVKGGYRPNLPADPSIIGLDDPLHTKRRKLVNRGFTPRTVLAWEDHVTATVTGLLDAVGDEGARRDHRAISPAPLPAQMIGLLLGFPHEMWPKLMDWSRTHHRRWRRTALRDRRRDHRRDRVRRRVRRALRGEAALPGRRHHDGVDDGRDRRRADRPRPGDLATACCCSTAAPRPRAPSSPARSWSSRPDPTSGSCCATAPT